MSEHAFDVSNPFADLESDLDCTVKSRPLMGRSTGDYLVDTANAAERSLKTTNKARIEVKCEKCRGSGNFYSYTGRLVGVCRACNGSGKILRAANYEQAKAARERRKAERLVRETEAKAAAISAWAEQFPAEFKWIVSKRATFDFAASMEQALEKLGRLTDGQLAAVQRCVERDAARDAERAARDAAPKVVGVNSFPRIEQLVRGKNLKLHLGDKAKVVMFQSGAVAVVGPQFGSGTFGIIDHGGGLRRFNRMSDEVYTMLQAVESRGLDAVREIGLATGRCCICGRTLTADGSIDKGIGPVCEGRMEGF